MKSTTIRFSENVLGMIHHQADLDGETATEFMRNAILEKLEDTLDYHDAVKNMQESHGETLSRQEVLRELGL